MSSGASQSRMPPGPGSLIVSLSVIPSSGCSLIASTLGPVLPALSGKIECGASLKTTAISDIRVRSRFPVRR